MNKIHRPDFGLIDLDKIRKKKRRDLTELEREEITEAFKLFDTDNDDMVDYHELKVSLRALGFELKKMEVQRLMADYDVEQTGKVTFDDFMEIAKNLTIERNPEEDLRKAFGLFAEESTGKISFRNLRRISKELGEKTSDDELRAMISEFDRDSDGEINFEEFMSIMTDEN